MKKWLFIVTACFLIAGCSGKQAAPKGEQVNFSIVVHGNEGKEYSKEEQLEIEQALRKASGNEPLRLLYFYEEFEEELSQERAIEIRYNEPKTIGSIKAERVVVFLSGRLKIDASSENNSIVTVHGHEVKVWNGNLEKIAYLLNH